MPSTLLVETDMEPFGTFAMLVIPADLIAQIFDVPTGRTKMDRRHPRFDALFVFPIERPTALTLGSLLALPHRDDCPIFGEPPRSRLFPT
jgi:hypothetical protein